MQTTVIDVECAHPRARVTMSAGAGTVLVPRLLGRTETSAHLALVAGGALLLPGDRLDVRIVVGAGCSLELTEVGGTVAYGTGGVVSTRRLTPFAGGSTTEKEGPESGCADSPRGVSGAASGSADSLRGVSGAASGSAGFPRWLSRATKEPVSKPHTTNASDAELAQTSHWNVEVTLGEGATLAWMGREIVVAEGADLTRTLRLDAAGGAVALIRETTVLGRSGERGGRARLATSVTYDGAPLFVEDTGFSGTQRVPGILGDARVMDTLLMAGRRPDDTAGVMSLEGPGALARYLGGQLHTSRLELLWAQWRSAMSPPL